MMNFGRERARCIDKASSRHRTQWLTCSLLLLLALVMWGCPGKPTLTNSVIKGIKIVAPADGKILNAESDADKQRPGVQLNVKVMLELEGEGTFPANVKVTLKTNGKREATVSATGKDISYEKYTLDEGANTLQATVTLPDGKVLNSETIQVTADSQCYVISFSTPKDGAVLGLRDDENTNKPGLQQTIIVEVDKKAVEPVKLVIKDENGKEFPHEAKPVEGQAAFNELTLPEGKVSLTARVVDAAGNVCDAKAEITVQVGAPAVSIESPTAAKQLCPADDSNQQEKGFQVAVQVKTSAEDKSEATLFLNGKAHQGPSIVANGAVTFTATLPDLQAITTGTLYVSVKDTLGNVGKSKEVEVKARTRGYELAFVGLLDGQTITEAIDADKNKSGIQLRVRFTTTAPDGVEHTLDFDGTKLTSKSQNGQVEYQVDLKEGKNCFEASVLEPTCQTKNEETKLCVNVKEPGLPVMSCKLTSKAAPAFDTNNHVALNSSFDEDTQTVGIQNTLVCSTDAEKDQVVKLDLDGAGQTKKLIDAAGSLREATFSGLTFKEGTSTLKVEVTNKFGKTVKQTYTVLVDLNPPSAITDLAATVKDHRKASAELKWSPPADAGSTLVKRYEVRYTSLLSTITEQDWDKPEGKVNLKITSAPGGTATAILPGLSVGKTYWIAIRGKDAAGNLGGISNVVKISIEFKSFKFTETGSGKGFFGYRFAVGDFDADGTKDVAVSEYRASPTGAPNSGAVHIFYGQKITSGSYFPSKPDVTITGESGSVFGQRLSALGDINGDGFDDFAVAAPRAASAKGRVYMFFGGPRGTSLKNGGASTLARVIITGNSSSDFFAQGMLAVGAQKGSLDLSGDKKADLLIGAVSRVNTGLQTKGAVFIFNSRATYPTAGQPALTLTTADADTTILNDSEKNGSRGSAFFGFSLASGDIDKDGTLDIVISAFASNTVLGFYGPLKPVNKVVKSSTASFKIDASATAGESFGTSMAIVGDINKDNKLDLVISANRGQAPGRPVRSGQSFLFSGAKLIRGAATLIAGKDAAVSWYGKATATFLDRVAPAGDLNNDGFDDFIITEAFVSQTTPSVLSNGAVYIFYGKASFSNMKSGLAESAADLVFRGSVSKSGAGAGGLLSNVDFTGDGFPDILFSETPAAQAGLKGRLYLKY